MIDLSSKEKSILAMLLNNEQPVSINALSTKLAISKRSSYAVIAQLNHKLLSNHIAPLQNVRGQGYYLIQESRDKVAQLDLKPTYQRQLHSAERRSLLIWELFTLEHVVTIHYLEKSSRHSRNTILKDIYRIKQEVLPYHIQLIGDQHGYHLMGDELAIRNFVHESIDLHSFKALFIKFCPQSIIWQYDKQNMSWLAAIHHSLPYLSSASIENTAFFYSGVRCRLAKHRSISPHSLPLNPFILHQMYEQPEYALANNWLHQKNHQATQEEVYYLERLLLGSSINAPTTKPHNPDINTQIRTATDQVVATFKNLDQVHFKDEDRLKSKLFQHLIATYYRVEYHLQYKNKIAERLRRQYQQIYLFTKLSLKPFEQLLADNLTDDEIGLISMYFGAELYQQRVIKQSALLVCPAGVGTSYLLKAQLQTMIPELLLIGPITKQDYQKLRFIQQDVVISTVGIPRLNKPVIEVDTILSDTDLLTLKKKLIYNHIMPSGISSKLSEIMEVIQANTQINHYQALVSGIQKILAPEIPLDNQAQQPSLSQLLTPQTIQVNVDSSHLNWRQAVSLAAQPLVRAHKINSHYIDDIIENVDENGPYIDIGHGIALAHARPGIDVTEVGMSMVVLNHPIDLVNGDHRIRIVIVMATTDSNSHLRALTQLTKILGSQVDIESITEAQSTNSIIQLIQEST